MDRHADLWPGPRTLPTRTFFYGMEPGEEISAEIDPGKTLEIRLQAVGETNEDGEVKVFFELNGQPRVIRVPDRRVKGAAAARPKAEPGNPNHIGAPMPGAVATVAVKAGQKVSQGDLLLTIEAMKMETGIHAERDATVKAVHVSPAPRSTPRICWSCQTRANARPRVGIPGGRRFFPLSCRTRLHLCPSAVISSFLSTMQAPAK